MPHPVLHAIVHGRVQGVTFRAHTVHVAARLGLGGWVQNLPDGTVEVEAVGEEPALLELRRWLDHGPPGAEVERVEVGWRTTDHLPPRFAILG